MNYSIHPHAKAQRRKAEQKMFSFLCDFAPLRELFLLIALLCPTVSQAQETVDLRPLWKKGQLSRYQMHQVETTVTQMPGLADPQESVTEFDAEVTWQVIEAKAEGGGLARLHFDNITIKLTGPSGQSSTVTAQQADPEFEGTQQYIKALMGGTLEVRISPDSQVGGIQGIEAIKQNAGPSGQRMNENYFKGMVMDLAMLTGGTAGIKPGQTWTFPHTSTHPLGQIHLNFTDEFKGVEEIAGVPVALVQQKAQVTFEPDLKDPPADAPPVQVRTTAAEAGGQILFDLSRHEIVGSQSLQKLGIEIKMTVRGRDFTRILNETTQTELVRIAEQ